MKPRCPFWSGPYRVYRAPDSVCAKEISNINAGSKAESLKDYDTALENYNKALQAEPNNTEYKLKAARARFEAAPNGTWTRPAGSESSPTWNWRLGNSGRPR